MAGRRPAAGRASRPTIRLRLALLYGAVFLVTGRGAADDRLPAGPRRSARPPPAHGTTLRGWASRRSSDRLLSRALGVAPGSPEVKLARAIQHQLRPQRLHRLLLEYLGALLAMTLVSIATGYLLAGRALRPLRAITATARRVSGENLGERIALAGPADELRELADTFDGMLGPPGRRLRQPAPLRGQRLARAAHAAGHHAHRGRRRPRRPATPAPRSCARWGRRCATPSTAASG